MLTDLLRLGLVGLSGGALGARCVMLGIHRSDHIEGSLLSNAGSAPQNPLLLLEKEGALEMTRLWGCAAWSKAGAERQGTGLTQLTSFILLVFSGYFGYLAMHREPTHIVGLSPFTSMLQADLCLCNTYGVSKCFGQMLLCSPFP